MKISLIIPTYNSEKVIGKCVESLLAQSVLPDEIIIVDGNSTDKTKEVCFSFNNPIIKFVTNPVSRTPGSNRNLGVRQAKNNYFVFIDSDCVADRGLIKNYKRDFQNHYCIAGNVKISNPGKISNFAYLAQKILLPNESGIIKNNFFWSMNFGITQEHFIEFIDSSCAEDLVFFTEFHKQGKQAYFSEDTIVYHSYPSSPMEYFNKQLFYARGFIKYRDQFSDLTHGGNKAKLLSSLDKDIKELKNLIDNKVSFDEVKGAVLNKKPDLKYLVPNLLTLATVIAIYESKGGVLDCSYEELVGHYINASS